MLSESDRISLARGYVKNGHFSKVLVAWETRGSKSGYQTNEATRRQVVRELTVVLQEKIAEGAIQLAVSWNDAYRRRDIDEWRETIVTDQHLKDELEQCLDYTTTFVDTGAKTSTAWEYVVGCGRILGNGVLSVAKEDVDRLAK